MCIRMILTGDRVALSVADIGARVDAGLAHFDANAVRYFLTLLAPTAVTLAAIFYASQVVPQDARLL